VLPKHVNTWTYSVFFCFYCVGDDLVDLKGVEYLALDWKNNPKQKGYVEVTEKTEVCTFYCLHVFIFIYLYVTRSARVLAHFWNPDYYIFLIYVDSQRNGPLKFRFWKRRTFKATALQSGDSRKSVCTVTIWENPTGT